METEPKTNGVLSKETCRLISGVISFLNGKDKELSEKSKAKGDNK